MTHKIKKNHIISSEYKNNIAYKKYQFMYINVKYHFV